MSTPIYTIDPDNLLIDSDAARAAADPYSQAYQQAQPYPHICIDNFLPEIVLDKVIADLHTLPEAEMSFVRPQENKKTSYIPERLPFYTRSLFYALNSRPFILFLEKLTGIDGLIPDPFFFGAGIHNVSNGGHLDIHADFNFHGKMNVERRLNILIYLNKDWKEEFGGSFEIWDKEMKVKHQSFVPLFNRLVIFSTGSDTFHGNPEPVNHPDGRPRLSIAMYYYTATWNETRKAHSTLFKPRPNSKDRIDFQEKRREIFKEITPPLVYRKLIGRLTRLGF